MDLMDKVRKFLSKEHDRLLFKLTQKYARDSDQLKEDIGIEDVEKVAKEVVSRFLEATYRPAIELALSISEKRRPVILFIGIESCPICKKGRLELEEFKCSGPMLELFMLDYKKDPPGLLYHMIWEGENGGPLPLIAIIDGGRIMQVWTGRAVAALEYEKIFGLPDRK